MLWSKQYYYYDVREWLDGDPGQPAPPKSRKSGRNNDWFHFYAADVIAMPDKWEYPWFAAWDWAFHLVTLALIDPRFAKDQLILLCQVWYMHPNGQMPAYEWNFSDVNPPVHAWAALRIYEMDKRHNGGNGDRSFLERVFVKLLLNFTWWVNRKDPSGRNVFQGGFLGLDNIGIFDRSAPLPVDGTLTQSDGTSWMAMFCLNMLRIALELAQEDHVYEDIAIKFGEHFLLIGGAMTNLGGEGCGLWDDQDNFYYDWLFLSSGEKIPLRLRSIVGLIPLFAVEVLDEDLLKGAPEFARRMKWFLQHRPQLAKLVTRLEKPGAENRRLIAIARAFRMKRVLERMLDESEFLSPYGVRAVSRVYLDHPYVFDCRGFRSEVKYAAGGVRQRHVRRQLQLAGAGLDADQLPDHREPVQVRFVLRRRLPRRVPEGLRHHAVARRGGGRAAQPPDAHLPARCARPPAGVQWLREAANRPAFQGLHLVP